MTNITARRRGRHAAQPVRPAPRETTTRPTLAVDRPARRFTSDHGFGRLLGMELLGFYDEPYRVHVEAVRLPHRMAPPVAQAARRHHSSPADLVADLWETTQIEHSALDRWNPNVVARRKLTGGRIRTATVVGIILAVAVVVVGGWMAFSRPAQISAEAAVAFDQATNEVTPALVPLTDLSRSLGAESPPDIVDSTATVLEAESATRAFFSAAGNLRGEDLTAIRESAVATAGDILDSTSQLSRLLAFRLATGQALVSPDLPPDPSALDIGAVTQRIAEWRADIDTVISDVPEGVLGDVQTEITQWHRGHQGWQERYLDAYREGDAEAVSEALQEQATAVSRLRRDVLGGLATAGDQIATTIETAIRSVQGYSVGG